jgi:hypothetical protein
VPGVCRIHRPRILYTFLCLLQSVNGFLLFVAACCDDVVMVAAEGSCCQSSDYLLFLGL